jgi:predicted ATPase
MTHKTITLENFALIQQGTIELADLTLLVGPQASGKTLFLQLFKLIQDHSFITEHLKKYGYHWNNKQEYLSAYFGAGMNQLLIEQHSVLHVNEERFNWEELFAENHRQNEKEKVFVIPAQRISTIANGWPRPFSDYQSDTPYPLKVFSDTLRSLLARGVGKAGDDTIYPPKTTRFNKTILNTLENTLFHQAKLVLDKQNLQQRIMLELQNGQRLPFMTWSSGQREFTPLLLGLYWLLPTSRNEIRRRNALEWAIIEEPEMGLHPYAIQSTMQLILELLRADYKVVISTHSPHVLDIIWAIKELQIKKSETKLLQYLFENLDDEFAEKILNEKKINTYFFDLHNTQTHIVDISSLSPSDNNPKIAGWGGITESSSRVAHIVAKAARAALGKSI